ncbi:MAG: sigma-70 family RNA polymerase sigma factor [Planctomycetales bacterium]|nr:sigma-70 family RNA polymerase sigma factor [Planctomycetales bacterium]
MKPLFEDAKAGDRSAFEQLLDAYADRLRRFVESRLPRHLRCRIDVDDVLQEISLRSFGAIERVEWRGENSLFCWLCGIAANIVLESERKFLRISDKPIQDDADSTASPSRQIRRIERFERLQTSFDGLNDDEKAVIRLIRIDGLPLKDVAKQIGRTEQATYQLLWRTMKKMKRDFGDTASLRLPDKRFSNAPNDE